MSYSHTLLRQIITRFDPVLKKELALALSIQGGAGNYKLAVKTGDDTEELNSAQLERISKECDSIRQRLNNDTPFTTDHIEYEHLSAHDLAAAINSGPDF